jgi:flagellar basal-body rod modification protein FlgD
MSVTNNNTPILTGYKSNVANSGKTDKGTPIVKKGQEIDKNAFLKILSAELSNQDPTSSSNQDSTQYVAQLAQFSSLEQMSNLNSTMTLNSASNLIGVPIKFNTLDSLGNNYIGIVKSVTRNGDSIKLSVATSDNGKAIDKDFDYGDIMQINPDISTSSDSSDSSNSTSEATIDDTNISYSNENANLNNTNLTTNE